MSDRYGSISISEETDSKSEKKPRARQPLPPKKRRNKSNRAFWLAIPVTFLLTVYFLGVTYLAPMALHKYLPMYVAEAVGLDFSMGEIKLNPFNFQLTVTDIRADLPDSTNAKPLLRVPYFFVDLDLTSLLRNSFVCDTLTIKKLSLNIIRSKDNHYNFPPLKILTEEKNQEQIIDFTNLPFLFSFNNIDISDSHIVLNDQVTDKTHTVEQLHLAIPTLSNFSFHLKDYILPHFSALINGSFIQLDGKKIANADGKTFQTRLYCSIKELQLNSYLSYLPDDFPLILKKGIADLKIELSFSPKDTEGDRLSIDIALNGSDILIHSKKGNNKIRLPQLSVDATLTPANKLLRIKTIIAKKPQLVTSQEELPRGFANFLAIGSPTSKHMGFIIDLLLFDEGRLVLTDKKDSIWNNLQLSINDFNSKKATGNFQVSGEQAAGPGSFSWQGKIAGKGNLQGKVLLNEFPAQTILSQFYTNANSHVTGSTEFAGNLNLAIVDKTTNYSLDKATLQFHKLQIKEKKQPWLTAESVRLTQLSRNNSRFSLGNILLKNAVLTLKHNEYPPLFTQVFGNENRPGITGIDFSGSFSIKPQQNTKETLLFSDVKFQANRLDQKKTSENFIFNAGLGEKGVIKTKGQITLFPLQLKTNSSFSNIDSAFFSPYFSQWPLLQNSEAMLHGKGVFSYPASSFQGTLRLSDGRLQRRKDSVPFSWDSADLSSFKCVFSPFSLQSSSLSIQNPQLQYRIDTESPFQLVTNILRETLSKGNETEELFPVRISKINFKNGSVTILDSP